MKKRQLPFLIFTTLLLLAGLPGCNTACKSGSGKVITNSRTVSAFSEISIEGAYRVILKQDTGFSCKVVADDNLLEYITTAISDNRLVIKNNNGLCPSTIPVVMIGMHDLTLLSTAGAVNVESNGKINAKNIELNLAGTSKITLNLNAEDVKTSSSGAAEVNLIGQARSHKVNFSGAGTLNALDFVVADYRIETSGLSNCKINVLTTLSVNSSGVSNVKYKGHPANVDNSKSGAATVSPIE